MVVATGAGAGGEPIYGVEYTWDVEGEALLETGDLLHYEYDPNFPVMVGASFGDQRAETMIRASTFDVDSTNDEGERRPIYQGAGWMRNEARPASF